MKSTHSSTCFYFVVAAPQDSTEILYRAGGVTEDLIFLSVHRSQIDLSIFKCFYFIFFEITVSQSFFINCCYIHICIHICIPKYNPLSPYVVSCMYVSRTCHLVMDNLLVYSSLEIFNILSIHLQRIFLCVQLKPCDLSSFNCGMPTSVSFVLLTVGRHVGKTFLCADSDVTRRHNITENSLMMPCEDVSSRHNTTYLELFSFPRKQWLFEDSY